MEIGEGSMVERGAMILEVGSWLVGGCLGYGVAQFGICHRWCYCTRALFTEPKEGREIDEDRAHILLNELKMMERKD